jgi:hypothetical protein
MANLISDKGDRQPLLRGARLSSRDQKRELDTACCCAPRPRNAKDDAGCTILTPLVGLWNVSFPSEQQIADSNFSVWNKGAFAPNFTPTLGDLVITTIQ